MVDIYCEPWLEFIVGWSMTPMKYITDELDLAGKAPNVFAFVEMFRSHQTFKGEVMNWEAANNHWTRTVGWEEGVKC